VSAPLEMNPEIRARWTAKLRSGTIPQAQKALYDGHGYCCLGVLCELAREDNIVTLEGDDSGPWFYGGEDAFLPEAVWEWAGLSCGNPAVPGDDDHTLAELNDNNWAFAQIADAIDGVAVTS
jgi:hypothetical protein